MGKKYFFKELKDYFSIFASFAFMIMLFSDNMAFATSCAEIYDGSNIRGTLDHCKTTEVNYSNDTNTFDIDGNKPAECSNTDLTYNPYTSPDYYYDSSNKYCLLWGIAISIAYAAASIAANIACNRFTPYVGVNPDDLANKAKKIATITKKILGLKSLFSALKSAKSVIVGAAGSVAVSVLTDPIIMLQIEFGLDALVLGFYTTWNTGQCIYWTTQASATAGLDPTADANAGTACTMAGLCAGALAVLAAVSQSLIWGTTYGIYNSANGEVNKIKLCGYDWESKVFIGTDIEEYSKNTSQLYPQTSSFANSYSYKLEKCFKYGKVGALDYQVDCSDVTGDSGYCELGSLCDNISIQSRTFKNRLYREMLYNGKEFKISTKYGSGQCIDPRPENQKGFKGVEQRYYFRGTNSAQYACKRFKYKNQGCILADGTAISAIDAAADETKSSLCKQAFEDAYNCCKSRAALGVCIYDTTVDIDSGRNTDHDAMCLRNLNSDDSVESCSIDTGKTSIKIEIGDYGIIYGQPEFIAFQSQEDSTMICIRNVNYCPYSYNVGGGTAIEDLYCNGDYSCTGAKPAADIDSDSRYLIPSEEDKEKIWDSTKNKTPTNAYGETKNYCTYNSHCTEIGSAGDSDFEEMTDNKFLPKVCSDFVGDSQNLPIPVPIINIDTYNFIRQTIFEASDNNIDIKTSSDIDGDLDKLTDDQITNILTTTINVTIVNNAVKEYSYTREALDDVIAKINAVPASGIDFDLRQYRGFTAPIVQCFKETLYNMFNNKAGQSSCKDSTEEVNAEGLCGTDTFGPPESIDTDKYNYIVGEDLSEDSNIFYKLQSRLQFLIKLIAIFAILIIGLNFLLKGEFDIFGEPKKSKAMVVELMKFAIVFYFAVGNAWQSKFYKWIDNASEYLYYKAFDLSMFNYAGYTNVETEVVCTQNVITTTYEEQPLCLQNAEFTSDGSFVISSDAENIKLEVLGGSGGTNGGITVSNGGYSYGSLNLPSAALNLNAGDTLYVKVGATGSVNNGGGATDIRLSNTASLTCDSSDPRIIVAGGGGGNGSGINEFSEDHYVGGIGGGGNTNGGDGSAYDPGAGGFGGTLTSGGVAGCHSGSCGTDGICGFGGNGVLIYNNLYGNGGDGWYGGGGASGGWSGGSGGGGSGYINSALINSGGSSGVNEGNGYAKISSYKTSVEAYSQSSKIENYVVENPDSTFPGGTIPETEYCSDSATNVQVCYSNCVIQEKKDVYGNKEYKWSEYYDGCYFGDSYYRDGKQYLAIFDSLDCKLMNYFNYSPDVSLPGILYMLLLSIIWSPLALIVVCLGSIFFIILLSIVIKICYIFLMSLFAVNLMIYISPIVFPSLLFRRYKNMFNTWLDSLMGYILQVVFVVVFAGLVIGNLENLGLGDAKYINHDPATGRLPVIDCPNSNTSLLCIFNVNISKGEEPLFGNKAYKFLGLGPIVAVSKSINNDFIGTVITLIKACLVLYVLLQFLKKIPNFALDLAGVKSLIDTSSKLEPGNMMKEVVGKTDIAMKAMKYGGRTLGSGIKRVGKTDAAMEARGYAVKAGGKIKAGLGKIKNKFMNRNSKLSASGDDKTSSSAKKDSTDSKTSSSTSKDKARDTPSIASDSGKPSVSEKTPDKPSPAGEGGTSSSS